MSRVNCFSAYLNLSIYDNILRNNTQTPFFLSGYDRACKLSGFFNYSRKPPSHFSFVQNCGIFCTCCIRTHFLPQACGYGLGWPDKCAHERSPHENSAQKKPHCHKCSHEKHPHGKLLTRTNAHTERYAHRKILTFTILSSNTLLIKRYVHAMKWSWNMQYSYWHERRICL
jgi:hypothetical protein